MNGSLEMIGSHQKILGGQKIFFKKKLNYDFFVILNLVLCIEYNARNCKVCKK